MALARCLVLLLGMVALSSCAQQEAASVTDEEARTIAVARKWVQAQGYRDSGEAAYEASPRAGTGDWEVLVTYLPPTPGDHTWLTLDSEFAVKEVSRGSELGCHRANKGAA